MKKLIILMAGIILASALNAQSLEDIIKKYSVANKLDKIATHKTIKLTGSMSMMGTDFPMTMWMKNPNKIKTVMSFNGQDIIQLFDGTKGYSVNPMTGSSAPQEMTESQVKEMLRSSMFQNYLDNYLKAGKLTLSGSGDVKGKPAFKITAKMEDGTVIDFFIDKSSYYMVRISSKVNQGGMTMDVDAYPTDFKEINGVIIPTKTTTSAQGMDMVMNFTNIEVDIPMEDSIFKI